MSEKCSNFRWYHIRFAWDRTNVGMYLDGLDKVYPSLDSPSNVKPEIDRAEMHKAAKISLYLQKILSKK